MDQAKSLAAERTVVRRAVLGDVPEMVMIGRRFFAETGHARFGITTDPHKLHESLVGAIDSDEYGVFVAVRGGAVVGVACAVRFTMYFTDVPSGMELFWWIDPALRGGGRTAITMFNALEEWAKEAGCLTFSMIDIPSITASPASEIYQRRGYELAERTWTKRI